MPQKKGKKDNKKVIKTVIKNLKQPLLKNSINIKIDLDDDNDKKKKPRRKKRQTKETANNDGVSFVDEVGKPISNDIINKSFYSSYMSQPFSRNSTVIGTSFNESAIMDRVMEKMSRLNNTSNMSLNQSTNNTSLNQSVSTPQKPRITPPQLLRPTPRLLPQQLQRPRPSPSAVQVSTTPMTFFREGPPQLPQAAPSTIAPASPTVASFNLSSIPETTRSPVRPLTSSTLPISQQLMMASLRSDSGVPISFRTDSGRAAELSKEEIYKIFGNMPSNDIDEIREITNQVDEKYSSDIVKGVNLSGKSSTFISKFKLLYRGRVGPETAASKAWKYYKQVNQLYSK